MPNEVTLTSPEGKEVTFTARRPEDFLEFKELPRWVRVGIAMHEVGGLSWAEVAKRTGRSRNSFKNYCKKSPAAKKWKQELMQASEDPLFMARKAFEASAMDVTMDYFALYEKAIDVGDYTLAAKMSQDMLDRAGLVRKRDKEDKSGKITVHLDFGEGGLEPPRIQASHEEVVEADFEVEED